MKMKRNHFLKTGVAAAAGFPSIIRARGLNEQLQIAFIGVHGQGRKHTAFCHAAGLPCVAFADVDQTTWKKVHEEEGWEGAAAYTDWREMFLKKGRDIDVVFIATPDHTHFAPSMTALSMGIHCYTEKPLSWSVREAQLLTQAYEQRKDVVTQMGNHGHAKQGWRAAYELVQGGAVGEIREFHTWTNRPGWPQGGGRPSHTSPVPKHLNWDAWIGPAAMRPYAAADEGTEPSKDGRIRGPYHPWHWRGFVDFGSGALGDMACHTTDGIYAIMNPGYAETVEPLEMTGPVGEQYPAGMVVKSTYRATAERPGFTTYWYEGRDRNGTPFMPETPEELKADGLKLPRTGNLIIGTEGKMLVQGDYWDSPRIIPEAKRRAFGRPEKLLDRSPGHREEFLMACRGEKPRAFSQSNFSYSGPMTANIQLGNLAARTGKKLVLNEAGKIISDPAINELAWREPRKGWGPMKSVL